MINKIILLATSLFEIYEKNNVINITTIITSLQDKNILKEIGGIRALLFFNSSVLLLS